MMPAAISWHGRLVRRRLADYLALAKPRVVLMVLVTTTVGYVLGSAAPPAFLPIGRLLVGTALARAQCHTIRIKLLKIGAQIRVTVRKVWVSLASGSPYADLFARVWANLRALPLRT